jgi:acid phosphatase type 7
VKNGKGLIKQELIKQWLKTLGTRGVYLSLTCLFSLIVLLAACVGPQPSEETLDPSATVVDVRVASSLDDVEERGTLGVNFDSSDLEMTLDKDVQTVGLHFAGLSIPKGATVTRAYLQFTTDEVNSEATSLTLVGEAADNAATFTTKLAGVSSKPKTKAATTWAVPAWTVVGEAGANQRANVTSIVQEIVNRPQWAAGNAVNIIVTGTGKRVAVSFNGDPTKAALLHIEYTGGGTTTPPPTPTPGSNVTLPARAAFYYPWFPETWSVNGKQVFYQPTAGYYNSSTQAIVDTHIKALDYAKVKVGIASWWGINTHQENQRIPLLLSRTQALGSTLKWSFYYEKEGESDPTVTELKNDLAYIKTNYASSPAYARVNGKPVIFVYNANDGTCAVTDRWAQAAGTEWYVVLKVFPNYKTCANQPSSWHQYAPAAAADRQPGYSYAISPGFWRADEPAARLARDLNRWKQNVRDMVASNEPWQLVTTFNEWGEGTATEAASNWGTAYLDALRNNGGSTTPTVGVSISLSPGSSSLQPGASSSFAAIVTGSANTAVTWQASGGTITGTGATITYKAPTGAGSYTLTATSAADTTKKATATVTVNAVTGGTSVTIAAAGDISCDPASGDFNGGQGTSSNCRMSATSNLLVAMKPSAVLALGDAQYENGSLTNFQKSYDLSWGRLKAITRPALGNHEYTSAGAAGYFSYFGAAAGDPKKGYYSYDVGAWHIIAINSNCSQVGGCGVGSAQETWLKADLAAHPTACTLAYWHHPRYSSGQHGNNPSMTDIWQALYNANAEIVLSGHDHDYERFAPQDAKGVKDIARGIRQFVSGTGGKNHYAIGATIANSEVHNDATYGVLKLTLNANSYSWQFVPEAGQTFTDSGTNNCH